MPDSIIEILSAGRDREAQASKVFGVVIGVVTNNKDPDKLGRVKVKFPWLVENDESFWARLATPMGGKGRGLWYMPEVDDEVLCAFEHGDIRFPYIVGGLWNGKDIPPETNDITGSHGGPGYSYGGYSTGGKDFNKDGKDDLRFFRSRSGHLLIFDDSSGKEKITLDDKTGKHRIEIFTDKKKVVITSEDGDIELYAKKKIYMECDDLETKSRKSTKMDAGSTFDTHAKMDMSHKTDKNLTLEAKMQETNEAKMMMTTKAGQMMTIEAGMMMQIKGGTLLKQQASIIMIN